MSFETLRAKWELDIERSVVGLLRKNADGDDGRMPMPGESAVHASRKPPFAPRILGRILDLLGSLYSTPVIRSGDPAWDAALWSRGVGLDMVFHEADRESLLGGTSCVVMIRGENNTVDSYVFGADAFAAESDPSNPRKVTRVALIWDQEWQHKTNQITTKPTGDVDNKTTWLEVDDQAYTYHLPSGDVTVIKHGLGIVPVVMCPSTYSTRTWAGRAIGGIELLQSLRTIQRQLEEISWTGLLQRGQPVLYEDDSRAEKVLAPDAPWKLAATSRAEFLANNANISGMATVVQMLIDCLVTSLGLDKQQFVMASIQPPYSAAVIQAMDASLAKIKKARAPICRRWEQSAHEIASRITGISPVVEVLYPEEPPLLTPTEVDNRTKLMVELGLVDRKAAARILRPHEREEVITDSIADAESERDADADRTARVAGHADDILTTQA